MLSLSLSLSLSPPFQVPDYLDVIKSPMDFTTMKKKVDANEYHTLHDFKKDFYLVWHNATIYNHKDTIYYRAALRIKEAGVYSLSLALPLPLSPSLPLPLSLSLSLSLSPSLPLSLSLSL